MIADILILRRDACDGDAAWIVGRYFGFLTPAERGTAWRHMRTAVPFLAFGVVLFAALYWHDQANKPKRAIQRVLEFERTQRYQPKADDPPYLVAGYISIYCTRMEKVDLAGCPADFIVAFREHIRAWRRTGTAIEEVRSDVLTASAHMLQNLLGGEADGGISRLRSDINEGIKDVRETRREVDRIAAKYGVVP